MTAAPALHLYVHWPFCRTKCAYCDFNSVASPDVDATRWQRALLRALADAAGSTGGRTVASIFFGGGTPSLMPPAVLGAIIDAAAGHWRLDATIEITLEANPTSAEAGRFSSFRAAGVNRISVGVQALDDAALRLLGRTHTVAEATAALDRARATFARVSFDLICGRPGQDVGSWRRELGRALEHAGEHVSVYELTIERGTALFRGGVAAAGEDLGRALYETTAEILGAAGFSAYEVSNHARPGAGCRHNLGVWRGDDYLGIGPGAHGRLRRADGRVLALRQIRSPASWLASVERGRGGAARPDVLGPQQRALELVLLGLRLAEGVRADRLRALTGLDLAEVLDREALSLLIEAGDLREDGETLRATARGRLRLDAVLGRLLA
jgi:oxygen-independent coproporphyrinogen-3 oxidase